MTATREILLDGALLVAAVRAAVALADARVRAQEWPLWRCGRVMAGIVAHDVVAGLAAYAVLAALPAAVLAGTSHVLVVAVGTLLALVLTDGLLHRRRGVPLTAVGRPGALSLEPVITVRIKLLDRLQQVAARASARWIGASLDDARRRACVNDDELLAAVWSPVRIRLRETVGVGRTEVALLLIQAQSVVDDGSPPRERLLTLLHLVHDRSGRRGVRSILKQAVRGPLRHGRSGSAPWGTPPPSTTAAPIPPPLATTPFPTTSTRDQARLH